MEGGPSFDSERGRDSGRGFNEDIFQFLADSAGCVCIMESCLAMNAAGHEGTANM